MEKHCFVIRLWPEDGEGSGWRGSLERVPAGRHPSEQRFFNSLEDLPAMVAALIDRPPDGAAD